METDNRLPTGEWNGFYLENNRPQRGWMHLYMKFADGRIHGEGTDYVGPWTAKGTYDLDSGKCGWVKEYVGKHDVKYVGQVSETGIVGTWQIMSTGEFHIWPRGMSEFNERYLRQDLEQPTPSAPSVPTEFMLEV